MNQQDLSSPDWCYRNKLQIVRLDASLSAVLYKFIRHTVASIAEVWFFLQNREKGLELFRTKKVYNYLCRLCENTWQEWAEGFQTLDDLTSVNLTPEDEQRIEQLLSGEAADGEEATC